MNTTIMILGIAVLLISFLLWMFRTEIEGRCRGCGKKLKDAKATYCSYDCSRE